MSSYGNGNVDKLRAEKLITSSDLPSELQAVVEGLTDDEVEILISVKRRLDMADQPADLVEPEERQRGWWEVFMVF